MDLRASSREIGGVTVIDLDGRITLGDGSALLRDLIRKNLDTGHRKLLLNLAGINYLDSTGLGELVSGYRLVKSNGGELKLLNLNK
jgi:anti-sigma B factor antagonist